MMEETFRNDNASQVVAHHLEDRPVDFRDSRGAAVAGAEAAAAVEAAEEEVLLEAVDQAGMLPIGLRQISWLALRNGLILLLPALS